MKTVALLQQQENLPDGPWQFQEIRHPKRTGAQSPGLIPSRWTNRTRAPLRKNGYCRFPKTIILGRFPCGASNENASFSAQPLNFRQSLEVPVFCKRQARFTAINLTQKRAPDQWF